MIVYSISGKLLTADIDVVSGFVTVSTVTFSIITPLSDEAERFNISLR
jgi:hypothetical protein